MLPQNRPFLHFSVHPRYLVLLAMIFGLAVVTMRYVAGAVDYLPSDKRTNGQETLAAFKAISEPVAASVVEVMSGGKMVAIGTVVSPLGYVVTKASEIDEKPIVRLPNGQSRQARVVANDAELDLALLVLTGSPLRAVRWGNSRALRIGDWVLSPGQEQRSWVGVISANRREIKRVGGALGVSLATIRGRRSSAVEIIAVVQDSPAHVAGLEPGDLVLMVDQRSVSSSEELISAIQQHDAGEEVSLQIVRDGERLSVRVELGFYSIFDVFNRNQRMSGETSDRRNGFPEVLQHSIPLAPQTMGSPLLNLRGEVVGINIARADRVTSYALPAERVLGSVRSMIQQVSSRRGTSGRSSREGG